MPSQNKFEYEPIETRPWSKGDDLEKRLTTMADNIKRSVSVEQGTQLRETVYDAWLMGFNAGMRNRKWNEWQKEQKK